MEAPNLASWPGKIAVPNLLLASLAFAQVDLGRWIPRGNPPNGRGEIGAAAVGEKIYMTGGISGSGGYRETFAYTPATNTWQEVAPMPVGLHHPNVGALDGTLYVLGGCDHGSLGGNPPNGSPWLGSRHTLAYDPALNQWRRIKAIPHSTAAGGVAAWGGKLYVIGGVDTNGVVLNLVQEYDPATDTWRERARMPTAREHIGVAVLDSLIYVVAGRLKGLGGMSVTNFEAYSPASDTWYVLKNLPTSRSGLAFAAARGKLYAMGGEWPGTSDVNEEYDPVQKTWRTVAKMPAARHGFAAVNYRDTVYALGARAFNEAYLPPAPPTGLGKVSRKPGQVKPKWSLNLLVDLLGRVRF